MKIVLEKVKIKYFNPKKGNKKVFDGVESISYDVMLFISEQHKQTIDTYIYGKCETTKDGEILFYGKSKNPIPFFDQNRQRIEMAIIKPFFADVSILIDEFTDKKTGQPIRYSKCLGIKFVEFTGEESTFKEAETYETFDEIFGDSENPAGKDIFQVLTKTENQIPVDCSQQTAAPIYNQMPPIENGLPF